MWVSSIHKPECKHVCKYPIASSNFPQTLWSCAQVIPVRTAINSAKTLLLTPRAPRTVTVNEQDAELLLASTAVEWTSLTPIGKVLPEAGALVMIGFGSQ